MAEVKAGAAVTVSAPADVTISPRRGTHDGVLALEAGPAPDTSALGLALGAASLSLVADFDLLRATGASVTTLAAGAKPVTVKVDVKADESALLLLETDGGVFAWQYPERRVAKVPTGLGLGAVSGPSSTLIFQISPDAPQGLALGSKAVRNSPVWKWIVEKTVGVIRARVLKFVAGKLEDAVVHKIEGGLTEGVTSLADADPAQWNAKAAKVALRTSIGPPRVLLMVHGTFSTTAGSFGSLVSSAGGKAFLEKVRTNYDAVIGFDHKTLGKGVEENAMAMLQAIAPLLPQGATIDAIAYSRGGLVYRVFAETLLPKQRPDLKLGKAAFVGCTNGGTHLAEPDNWEALVDLYTNVTMAASRMVSLLAGGGALSPIVTGAIETIASFVKYMSVVGVTDRRVPGLADMEPNSTLVEALNGASPVGEAADYFAITSNFVAHIDAGKAITAELKQMLVDKVTNRLFATDNDLVVDTSSMISLGKRQIQLKPSHIFEFGDREDVYHTVYFASSEAVEQLQSWF